MTSILEKYAAINDKRLVTDLSTILNKKESLAYNFFSYVATNKTVCINVNLQSLDYIFQSGVYKNTFQLGYDADSIRERYSRQKLSSYYEKLMAFVEAFDMERNIKYGSLNIGGLGSNYPDFGNGLIAIILKDEFVANFQKAIYCLKRFSLNYYSNKPSFKEVLFKNDICTWNKVEYLALEKHIEDIKGKAQKEWSKLVSIDRGWLEILIFNQIVIQSFEEIRFDHDYFEYLNSENIEDKYHEIQQLQFKSIAYACQKEDVKIVKI